MDVFIPTAVASRTVVATGPATATIITQSGTGSWDLIVFAERGSAWTLHNHVLLLDIVSDKSPCDPIGLKGLLIITDDIGFLPEDLFR